MRKSPTRAGMRRVLQELGTAPSASFMVGDSVTDVETARAAGLAGIIVVSYGYTAIPARALGADAVIDHLDGLPAAVCVSPPQKLNAPKISNGRHCSARPGQSGSLRLLLCLLGYAFSRVLTAGELA